MYPKASRTAITKKFLRDRVNRAQPAVSDRWPEEEEAVREAEDEGGLATVQGVFDRMTEFFQADAAAGVDAVFQFLYLIKLEPDVLTSCCGVLFKSSSGDGYNLLDPYSPVLLLPTGRTPTHQWNLRE